MKNVIFLTIMVISVNALSQVNSQHTYKFLNLPTSAKSGAMGGSFISPNGADLNLVADNPAVLDSTLDGHFTMNYINYITNVNMGYLSGAKHYQGVGTFSMGIQFMGYGEFIRADETGNQLGTFRAGDYAFDVSYGKQIDSLFSIGASMKLIYSSYDYLNSFGIGFDLGGRYVSKNKLFVAGFVINNMGAELVPYFKGDRQPLPTNIQLAGSIKLSKAPLRFTFLANNLQTWDLVGNNAVSGLPTIGPTGNSVATSSGSTFTAENFFRHFVFGVEILPSKNFFIQLSYNYLRKAELSIKGQTNFNAFAMGFGFKIKRFNLAYSLASYAPKASSHHISLSTNIHSFR